MRFVPSFHDFTVFIDNFRDSCQKLLLAGSTSDVEPLEGEPSAAKDCSLPDQREGYQYVFGKSGFFKETGSIGSALKIDGFAVHRTAKMGLVSFPFLQRCSLGL